jgi:hypothetical protein
MHTKRVKAKLRRKRRKKPMSVQVKQPIAPKDPTEAMHRLLASVHAAADREAKRQARKQTAEAKTKAIMDQVLLGRPLNEVAAEFGVTRQWVSLIARQHDVFSRRHPDPQVKLLVAIEDDRFYVPMSQALMTGFRAWMKRRQISRASDAVNQMIMRECLPQRPDMSLIDTLREWMRLHMIRTKTSAVRTIIASQVHHGENEVLADPVEAERQALRKLHSEFAHEFDDGRWVPASILEAAAEVSAAQERQAQQVEPSAGVAAFKPVERTERVVPDYRAAEREALKAYRSEADRAKDRARKPDQ